MVNPWHPGYHYRPFGRRGGHWVERAGSFPEGQTRGCDAAVRRDASPCV